MNIKKQRLDPVSDKMTGFNLRLFSSKCLLLLCIEWRFLAVICDYAISYKELYEGENVSPSLILP